MAVNTPLIRRHRLHHPRTTRPRQQKTQIPKYQQHGHQNLRRQHSPKNLAAPPPHSSIFSRSIKGKSPAVNPNTSLPSSLKQKKPSTRNPGKSSSTPVLPLPSSLAISTHRLKNAVYEYISTIPPRKHILQLRMQCWRR